MCLLFFDEHAHSSVLTNELITKIDICLKTLGINKPIYLLTCNFFNNNKNGKLFKVIYYGCYELIAKSLKFKIHESVKQKEKKRFLCLNLRRRKTNKTR